MNLDKALIIFMIIHMRSTLVLDDHLFKRARQRAAALGTTLSDVVNQALRDALMNPPAKPVKFKMLTFGNASRPVHREPTDFADAVADDDARSVGR